MVGWGKCVAVNVGCSNVCVHVRVQQPPEHSTLGGHPCCPFLRPALTNSVAQVHPLAAQRIQDQGVSTAAWRPDESRASPGGVRGGSLDPCPEGSRGPSPPFLPTQMLVETHVLKGGSGLCTGTVAATRSI